MFGRIQRAIFAITLIATLAIGAGAFQGWSSSVVASAHQTHLTAGNCPGIEAPC